MNEHVTIDKIAIYPYWMADKELMQRILSNLVLNNGQMKLSDILISDTRPLIGERLEKLINRMKKDGLVSDSWLKGEKLLYLTPKGALFHKRGFKNKILGISTDFFNLRTLFIILVFILIVFTFFLTWKNKI